VGALIGLIFGLGVVLMVSGSSQRYRSQRRTRRKIAWPGTELLERAGLPQLGPRRLWLGSALLGLCMGLVVMTATGLGTMGGLAAIVFGALPTFVLRSRVSRRSREFAEAWPDAIDHLASGIRAGLSLPEAMIGLATRGPTPLREQFACFGRDYQASGRFSQALDLLKARLADPTGDRVVEALRLARDVGGSDLGRTLRALSAALRDDARTRGELVARQSWTVVAARVAVAAPWLVLALMSFQGEVLSKFARPSGTFILIAGAFACSFAYWLMLRLGRLREPRRVLR
jgi:tight adherence protein B